MIKENLVKASKGKKPAKNVYTYKMRDGTTRTVRKAPSKNVEKSNLSLGEILERALQYDR